MTNHDEIDLEIRNQAIRLFPRCNALFELPLMVYWQIAKGNVTRKNPYRVGEKRIKAVIDSMPELQ